MEQFTQMMNQMINNLVEMQKETQTMFTDALKGSQKLTKDQMSIIENNIKFHKAAAEYHNSLVKMNEAIKDTADVISGWMKGKG